MDFHRLAGIGAEQGPEGPAVILGGVEPAAEVIGREDDGHAVVKRAKEPVRPAGHDGARFHIISVGSLPALPQPRHGEGLSLPHLNEIRLLFSLPLRPFVKSVRRNQATPLPEGGAEGGLLGQGLGPGVDRARADGGLFRPMRNQAPPEESQFARSVRGGADSPHLLARRDVVPGRKRDLPCELEQGAKTFEGRRQGKPAAHGHPQSVPAAGSKARGSLFIQAERG